MNVLTNVIDVSLIIFASCFIFGILAHAGVGGACQVLDRDQSVYLYVKLPTKTITSTTPTPKTKHGEPRTHR